MSTKFRINGCNWKVKKSECDRQGTDVNKVYVKLGSCKIYDQKLITKTKLKFKQRKSLSGSTGCILGLYILNKNHTVQLQKDVRGKPNVNIDGNHIGTLPYQEDWIHIKENMGREILLSLIRATIQITITYPDLAFTIRLPSAKYGSKLEGLCGDCNGDPNNDLQINPKQQQDTIPETTIEKFVESWQNDKLDLGSDEKTACSSKQDSLQECIPPPSGKDPCMKIMDQEIFGQCHILVDPTMFLSACQDEMCKVADTQSVICETLSAYAKECFRHGICINWRKHDLCPFECPPGFNYKPCSCIKTCDTLKEKGIPKTIKLGIKSASKNIDLKKLCTLTQMEACICDDGKVLNGTNCISEKHCVQCDDGHYAGDTWRTDKCTECNCDSEGKVVCTKQECSVIEKICEDGFTPVERSDSDACCSKYICVPVPTVPTPITCPKPMMPSCGPDQLKKSKTGPDGCIQYYCECKPLSECSPANLSRELKVGEIIVNNSMGCCPTFEIVCVESKCPPRPNTCENPFHEIIEKKEEGNCCMEFLCAPPKDACLIPTDDTVLMKKIGEKWVSTQPCLSHVCTYGPDGLPLVMDEKKVCETTCNEGFEYIVDDGKCCGKCIQTMCNYNETFYKPGDIWYSDDNCTTYKCEVRETNFYIEVSTETCPDITTCPENQKYEDGCCMRCKLQTDSQKNCLPVSMVDTETIGIIQIYEGKHGICKNKDAIYGFTECQGSCSSGSKFNTATHVQEPFCQCCKPEKYDLLAISLKCNDGSTTTKQIQIPSSCSCSPCSESIPFSEVDAEYVKIGKGVDQKKKYSKSRGIKKG